MDSNCEDLIQDLKGLQSNIVSDIISKIIILIASVITCFFVLRFVLEKLPVETFMQIQLSTLVDSIVIIVQAFFTAALWFPINKYRTLNRLKKEIQKKFDANIPCDASTCYMINRTIVKLL